MNEGLTLLLAWLSGGLLGAFFFGGLWWTVMRGTVSKQPALWFSVSLLLRTGVAMAGFYFFSGGHLDRLVLLLLGFVLARHLVMRLTGPMAQDGGRPALEASHAP